MEISSTFWLLDITDWWRQQEEMHSKYANLSNAACYIFCIIPHGVKVEASFSLGREVIRLRQWKITAETVREKVIVMKFARANNRLLPGDDLVLDTTNADNDMKMLREVE